MSEPDFLIKLLVVLIPALPLAGAILSAVFGSRVLRDRSHWPVVGGIGLSCVASLALVFVVARGSAETPQVRGRIGYEKVVRLWTWAAIPGAYAPRPAKYPPGWDADREKPAWVWGNYYFSGDVKRAAQSAPRDFVIDVTLRADPLTAIMLGMVTFLSFMVAVYSIGYMRGERGYWRFFAYIGLFVFSMNMLVLASNFVLLYVFWEAVGLCSYFLIGFWYQRHSAAAAAKKAFLVNRVGDFGFALGIFLIWTAYGTLNFHDTAYAGVLGQTRLAGALPFIGGAVGTAICLLLLAGACGKSAQFPLHVWLPDAMEGPTPVSALIHAATMVTAGVYMVARCTPLFHASIDAQHAVALIGAVTALMAAIIAVTQTDLKRILAYSTISQLGFMFLSLGAGTLVGVTAGMFHLFTHGFFKALLFLGAGSVMHAMGGVIDIRRFGGLRRVMPTTHWTFLVGCLALAGFPLFSGFWSKDEILAAVGQRAAGGSTALFYGILYWMAVLTALLTAFYSFRAYFLTFWGEERIPHEAGHHAHESPPVMTVPLAILAVFALGVGAVLALTHSFSGFLQRTPSLAFVHGGQHVHAQGVFSHTGVMITSSVVALAGIGLAALFYLGWAPRLLESVTGLMQAIGLYALSSGKFFVDVTYNVLVVWPLEGLALLSYWFDRNVVDGLVDLAGYVWLLTGAALRPLQNGLVQCYALVMVLGMLILLAALLTG